MTFNAEAQPIGSKDSKLLTLWKGVGPNRAKTDSNAGLETCGTGSIPPVASAVGRGINSEVGVGRAFSPFAILGPVSWAAGP